MDNWHMSQNHWLTESSKETFFFHCAQRYAVWEAACHLWCRVTAKWPIQQCVLTTMNQTTFQLCMPGGLNLDIHILIHQYIYIYYLNLYNNIYIYMNILHIKTHCWFDQTMADVCWQMYPFGQIYYRSLLDISHWEAISSARSSRKQLS